MILKCIVHLNVGLRSSVKDKIDCDSVSMQMSALLLTGRNLDQHKIEDYHTWTIFNLSSTLGSFGFLKYFDKAKKTEKQKKIMS